MIKANPHMKLEKVTFEGKKLYKVFLNDGGLDKTIYFDRETYMPVAVEEKFDDDKLLEVVCREINL